MNKEKALQILRQGIDGLGNDGSEYDEIATWLEVALPDNEDEDLGVNRLADIHLMSKPPSQERRTFVPDGGGESVRVDRTMEFTSTLIADDRGFSTLVCSALREALLNGENVLVIVRPSETRGKKDD